MKTAIALLLMVASVSAQDLTGDQKKSFLEAAAARRDLELKVAEERLEIVRHRLKLAKKGSLQANLGKSAEIRDKGTPKERYVFDSKASRENVIKNCSNAILVHESEVSSLSKLTYMLPILEGKPTVGDAGIFRVNATTAPTVKILQVIDKGNVIIKLAGESVWLRTNTEGMTDGREFELDYPVIVEGTRTYKTLAGGSLTVNVMVRLNLPSEFSEQLQKN